MRKFWIDCLFATIFVFVVMLGVGKITKLNVFNAFDPISNALSDFELSDFAFNSIRPDPTQEERVTMDKIVLVNFSKLDRMNFAQELQIIAKYKPKVVGIDGFYNCEGGLYNVTDCPQLLDTLGNLLLANAMNEIPNLVLVSKLLQSDSLEAAGAVDVYDSVEYADWMFREKAHSAYANLVTDAQYQEGIKICKSFAPKWDVKGKDELAFAVQVAMLYDSVKTKKFLRRGNETEVISYRGNFEVEDVRLKNLRKIELGNTDILRKVSFTALDIEDVIEEKFDSTLIKDKIVLIGFLGDRFGDPAWDDKFFTPLNKKIGGRANPDMFGLVIHANIIAAILNEDYVDQLSTAEEVAIAFIICLLNVALFSVINRKWPVMYDGISVIIQVIEIVLCSFAVVLLFAFFNFKSSLGATMGAMALVGPCFDVYYGLVKPSLLKLPVLKLTTKPKEV
ncbi:MAG: CHASE2 domain-containing protein [Chryseolinea sp.]